MGRLIPILALLILFGCQSEQSDYHNIDSAGFGNLKINGVSFTSPPQPITSHWTKQIKRINANWVAIIPYGFCQQNTSTILYNDNQQWWGEKTEGIITLITQAKEAGYNIMIKPQVWIPGSWPGDFSPNNQNTFEKTYTKFILDFAQISDSLHVDLFCVGTEFKINSKKHHNYWSKLIDSVKNNYSGKITYAANWDNYQNIKFWDQLDFIGIDAYFPLSKNNDPSEKTLLGLWKPLVAQLKTFSSTTQKPILFTEYGYRNIDKTTWNQWENDDNYNLKVNHNAQSIAFSALFKSVWGKPWFAGGFIWKWYDYDHRIDPKTNNDYTPQNKPVEEIIREYYE